MYTHTNTRVCTHEDARAHAHARACAHTHTQKHTHTHCGRSWREFPHPEEEDTEGCESREHKRWLERQNAKLREKGARLVSK